MSVNLMSAIFETEFFDLKNKEGEVTKASTAKLVLLAMADHANDEGEGAYPSISRLARKTALSEQTIRNTFECLRHNGVIILEGISKHGTNNHTINTKSFPKAKGKEVTVLTLNPLDPQMSIAPPSNEDNSLTYSFDPNHITIKETPIAKHSEIQAEYKHPIDKMDTLLEFEKLAQRLKNAQIEFETQLGFNPAWSKPDWEKQNKKIADLLDKDPNVLKDFSLWRKGEGKYQGLTNASMAKTATFFMDVAYPTFLASVAMSGTSNTKGATLDDNGVVVTY